MAIIVEGFDNSGKSTLAASFGLEIVHPGPRPKNQDEVNECLKLQVLQARFITVMDRVTAISHPCYAMRDPNDQEILSLTRMLNTKHCVLIYCRPPIEVIKDFSRHICKSYDEVSKINWLQDNAEKIVAQYDRLMSMVPHMKYDYTNPDPNVVKAALKCQLTPGEWQKCKELMNT